MLKVTITALVSPITIQDPKPVSQTSSSQAVITVEYGTPASWVMQWQQLERIQSQLVDLETLGLCSYVIESAGVAGFAEQAQGEDNPAISGIDNGGAVLTVLADTPTIIGTNLIGDQVQATASVLADTVAGSITIDALPGADGNLSDFTVVDSLGGGLAVTSSVVAGRTVIEIDLGGSAVEDVTGITAALNAALAGAFFATAVGAGATVVSTLQTATPFTGGTGPGVTVLLGGAACTITSIDISAAPIISMLIGTPALTGTFAALDVVELSVRAGNKIATLSTTLA